MRPPDSLPVAQDPGADLEAPETPEQAKARRVAAFVARGPRYARHAWMVDADPFAIACELVDMAARLDGLAETVLRLEQRDRQAKAAKR